jgi:hypothetical protein
MNSRIRLAESFLLLFVLMNVILYGFCDQPQTPAASVTRSHLKFLFLIMEGKRAVLESGLLWC